MSNVPASARGRWLSRAALLAGLTISLWGFVRILNAQRKREFRRALNQKLQIQHGRIGVTLACSLPQFSLDIIGIITQYADRVLWLRALGAGLLDDPRYVAIDAKGRALVTDRKGVHVFAPSGGWLRSLTNAFSRMQGIIVHENNRVEVYHEHHGFATYDSITGRLLETAGAGKRKWGTSVHGTALYQNVAGRTLVVNVPCHLAVDANVQRVYMTLGTHQVQVCDLNVKPLGKINLTVPRLSGIATDASGNLLVASRKRSLLCCYDPRNASLLWEYHVEGSCRFEGLATDQAGLIYACDSKRNQVLVFG